jgi:hypothetical protein
MYFSQCKNENSHKWIYFNRFWFFKIAAIIGIMIGSFYIPGGSFTEGMTHCWGVNMYNSVVTKSWISVSDW